MVVEARKSEKTRKLDSYLILLSGHFEASIQHEDGTTATDEAAGREHM